jgi:hypothetical protein
MPDLAPEYLLTDFVVHFERCMSRQAGPTDSSGKFFVTLNIFRSGIFDMNVIGSALTR